MEQTPPQMPENAVGFLSVDKSLEPRRSIIHDAANIAIKALDGLPAEERHDLEQGFVAELRAGGVDIVEAPSEPETESQPDAEPEVTSEVRRGVKSNRTREEVLLDLAVSKHRMRRRISPVAPTKNQE